MDSFAQLALWFAVIFPLVFSAGPGNVLCAVCGATNGFRQSIPFILGLNLVYTSYALLAGFGLSAILSAYPRVFIFVQILGVAYIFWLGYKFLLRKDIQRKEGKTKLRFIDGVISQALNIKGITIVITMYSQFLNPENSIVYEVLTLSFSLLLLNLFTHMTWSYGGSWMAQKFASSYAVELQSKIFGGMLIFISFWLLYQAIYS
ncbi:LysE family translocator [Poseidonibacter antarcticus]|uniref:LysE family translocator n=1 Tax=Poseidonibacter antarcticus TaxID=2478538 RepID=UPI000EF4FBDE|nr:LysE family translocator [Poseidonibacter antarcticus]